MLLSEHVYCVAITFKMTKLVEQRVCIIFFIKLEPSFAEAIWMIQKATDKGNWWWAVSSQRCACSCILAKHQITQVTQPLYSPHLAPWNLWHLPKLKHLWKGRDFRSYMRFRKIWQGSWWWLGKLCEVPRCLLWRELRSLVLCTMFLISCIFFNKCLYFHST